MPKVRIFIGVRGPSGPGNAHCAPSWPGATDVEGPVGRHADLKTRARIAIPRKHRRIAAIGRDGDFSYGHYPSLSSDAKTIHERQLRKFLGQEMSASGGSEKAGCHGSRLLQVDSDTQTCCDSCSGK